MSKYKLICLDVDGVLVEGRNFWLDVHKAVGTFEKGEALTREYLHKDYDKLAQEVVYKLWKGKDAKPIFELAKKRKYMKGINELFEVIKKNKWISALISGGSFTLAERIQQDYGVNYIFANKLIIKHGKIVGYEPEVNVGKERKAKIIIDLCKKLGIDLREVIFIGDTDYDIEAFKIVGKAIAFNAESKELKKYTHILVESNDLRDVLPHLET